MPFTSILTDRSWSITVNLQDNIGKRYQKRYEVNPEGATIEEEFGNVQAMAVNVATKLQAITELTVVGVGVSLGYPEDNYDGTGTGDGSNSVAVICNLVDTNKTSVHYIPAPEQDIMLATSGANAAVLDISDVDVLAYFDLFKTAGVSGVGRLELSDGEVVRTDNPITSGTLVSKRIRWD